MFVAVGQKQGKKRASDHVDAADVHVIEAVEVLVLSGFNGTNMADSRIVDENVEAIDVGGGGGDGVGAGDVERHGLGGARGFCQRLGGGKIYVGDPDECAGAD